MFLYNLRLARRALGQQPLLTALMIAAIAVGVGACMTVTAFVYSVSADPIPEKSDVLYAVRVDAWDPENSFDDELPEEAPWQLTHRDAMALMQSPVPTRHAAMRKAVYTVVPENIEVAPFLTLSRMTGGDFFQMFDVPFIYGSGWSETADDNAESVVVLSRETNEKIFGGVNSVGKEVLFEGESFRVVGVIDTWQPSVKFYDVNNGALQDVEDVFMPFSISDKKEIAGAGNTNCWKSEVIDTYFDMLQSECIFTQFWAELKDDAERDAYQSWLDAYAEEQKALGRHERPVNNRLSNVTDWLKIREVVGDSEKVVLSIAVLFLVACLFNTIGLILARFVSRSQLTGIRRALGASRAVVFRQHIVEVGLVGFAGGIGGILLTLLGLAGLRKLLPDYEDVVGLDPELVLFTVLLAVLAAIAAGLYPAWRVCRTSPARYLKTQ